MRSKVFVLAVFTAGLIVLAVLAIFSGKKTGIELTVHVSVKSCPPSSSNCYDLPVPDVDVVATGDGTTLGTTDGAGNATLRLSRAGRYTVTARSFIIQSGLAERIVDVKQGARKTIELQGDIVRDAGERGDSAAPPR